MLLPGALFVLPAALIILAGALLIVGLRGRAVDDHPLCRRCGFDLIGLPTGSHACSECGANLREDRAVRTGHRARRKGMIALSLALLLPSLIWIGIAGYVAAANVNWISYKPVWWLLRDAESDPASLPELLTRLTNNKLSTSEVSAVIGRALTAQADHSRPWHTGWGDFVEKARVGGHVSDTDWARYAQQAVVLDLRARREVARGDPIWVEVSLKARRLGRTWSPDIMGLESSCCIDGVDCGDDAVGGFFFGGRGSRSVSGSLLRPRDEAIASLEPGAKKLTVSYDIEIESFHGQFLPVVKADVQTTFVLREPLPRTVELEANAAALEQIRLSAGAPIARYYPSGDMSVSISLSSPPSFDLAYDVFAVLPDGTERKLSSYTAERGRRAVPAVCSGEVGRLPPTVKTIAVVLRPSVDVALQSFTLNRLCAGEIRIERVFVQRAGTARPPPVAAHERVGP